MSKSRGVPSSVIKRIQAGTLAEKQIQARAPGLAAPARATTKATKAEVLEGLGNRR